MSSYFVLVEGCGSAAFQLFFLSDLKMELHGSSFCKTLSCPDCIIRCVNVVVGCGGGDGEGVGACGGGAGVVVVVVCIWRAG